MSEDASARLQNCFKANTEEESMKYYSEWAKNYESDIVQEHHWQAPQILVKFVTEHVTQRQIDVVDIGAGTGLVGLLLKEVGFTNIDAHDGCAEMLQIAKSREIYRSYFEEIFHEYKASEVMQAQRYDLAVSVGTFLPGHMNEKHLEAFISPVKKNGMLLFGMNEHSETPEFLARLKDLEQSGKLKRIERRLIENYRFDVHTQTSHSGVYYAYEVC